MNEIAKILKAGVNQATDVALALAPGLRNFGQDVKAEAKRLGIHGQMEMASVNHTGNAFVLYGPGQYLPSMEPSQQHDQQPDHQPDHQQEQGHEQVHEHDLSRER